MAKSTKSSGRKSQAGTGEGTTKGAVSSGGKRSTAADSKHAGSKSSKNPPEKGLEATAPDALQQWRRLLLEGAESFNNERYVQAEEQFKQALELAEKIAEQPLEAIGRAEPLVSVDESISCLTKSLNNLAALYHAQGKYGLAEELYDRCLDLKLKIYGEDHLETAVNIHNLAVLFAAKRMYLKAEILFKRALEIREKNLGECHEELVPILKHYALLLRKTNRKDEAIKADERIAGIESMSGMGLKR